MNTAKKNAKEKIVEAAWELFLEKGYDETTLDDIIKASHTSKGGFYHHFQSKEELLFQMASFFDNNYPTWASQLDPDLHTADKLLAFDAYTSRTLEDSPYRVFLPKLYGYEVMAKGERYILSETRDYYRLVLSLFQEGQEKGEITKEQSANSFAHTFARIQRGVVYGWLLERCAYPLAEESHKVMTMFLNAIRTDKPEE